MSVKNDYIAFDLYQRFLDKWSQTDNIQETKKKVDLKLNEMQNYLNLIENTLKNNKKSNQIFFIWGYGLNYILSTGR